MEAIARRVRVDLTVGPARKAGLRCLITRLLSLVEPDRLAMDIPRDRGRKVHLANETELGLFFSLGGYRMQTRTKVVDHCQLALRPGHRVDSLVVGRPEKLLTSNRRRSVRHQVDPSRYVAALLWEAEALSDGRGGPASTGWLVNVSAGGLGIHVKAPLPVEAGEEMVVRLKEIGAGECRLLRATLKHCTANADGMYTAGLGDVVELGPGQAIAMIETILAGGE